MRVALLMPSRIFHSSSASATATPVRRIRQLDKHTKLPILIDMLRTGVVN